MIFYLVKFVMFRILFFRISFIIKVCVVRIEENVLDCYY